MDESAGKADLKQSTRVQVLGDKRASPAPAAMLPERIPAYGSAASLLGADRRVNEQDCTTGIDLFAGNLRCR